MTWIGDNLGLIWEQLREHLYLAILPVILGLIISVPLGYIATRYAWLARPTSAAAPTDLTSLPLLPTSRPRPRARSTPPGASTTRSAKSSRSCARRSCRG